MGQDLEARVGADTTGLQAGMVQAATVTEAQMKRIAQYVKAANDSTAKLEATARATSASVKTSYEGVAAAAKKVEGGHAGVNRELLVLAHEISQGNFKQFGGSLLVLAEQTNALQFAMSGAGAGALALGGAVIGAGALIAKGAIEIDKVQEEPDRDKQLRWPDARQPLGHGARGGRNDGGIHRPGPRGD